MVKLAFRNSMVVYQSLKNLSVNNSKILPNPTEFSFGTNCVFFRTKFETDSDAIKAMSEIGKKCPILNTLLFACFSKSSGYDYGTLFAVIRVKIKDGYETVYNVMYDLYVGSSCSSRYRTGKLCR
ncbi:MAG: hypothetical protein SOR57_03320 [Parabacteroides sp.]|nr:hypothetical protein [Parabacteroides sp.]